MPTLNTILSPSGHRKQGGKLTISLLVLLAICIFGRTAEAKYGGGTGGLNDPYLIYTAEQMNVIGANRNDWDKHFRLMADIDLSAYTGTSFNIIGSSYGSFRGVFDGNGHTISNFSYFSANTDNVGIFGQISGENALIKDLGLINPNVDAGAGNSVGSLVGNLRGGTISNCYVEGGSVSGAGSMFSGGVGGLVGDNNYYGTITDSYASASVSGVDNVGGLVGENGYYCTITNCYTAGSVSGSGTEWWPGGVGGLVGSNEGTIFDCSSTGSVAGTTNVGGLVGNNGYSSAITSSYSSSIVTGSSSVGGLVGYNHNILTYCYATGSVVGTTNVGGLVGENDYGTITNCYATASVTGTAEVGGLVGAGNQWGMDEVTFSFWDIQTSGQATSAGGMGMTTAEMQNPNTFMDAGWDFVDKSDGPGDIWAEPADGGYPILWWQLSPLPELPTFPGGTGEPNDPYIVSKAADLNIIGHNPRLMRAHFDLTNDIDLAGIDFYIIGREAFPFTGVFYGNSHTISNFRYSSIYRTEHIGLFGYVDGPNAEIRDLGLIAPNITGQLDVGSLVGQLGNGTVSSCYAEGGSVSGRNYVGGLVGENSGSATITNCYAQGVSVMGFGQVYGGLVGSNSGTITNCHVAGSVLGAYYVGGLVGSNNGRISKCYSAGSVMGDDNVGGLVGTSSSYSTIADCYATSSVVGIEHVGGLVGSGGCAHNSFWDTQTSGQTTSASGKGRTTVQMQIASTFLGWDRCGNEGVWTIDEGNDYPRLWWENKPGEALATQQLSALLTGAGTQDDPYLIYTAEELNVIGVFPCELDKYFKLMDNIDLNHYEGTEFNIIGITSPFTGVFDGNGKKITNLNHTRGLFVYVSGAIKDLGLIDANVDAGTGDRVGSLAGTLTDGAITNCYAEGGSVSGNGRIGGLVGDNNYGTITNCSATASITGTEDVGGLVGYIYYGTITDCYAAGSVSGSGTEYWPADDIGGLVGENYWDGTIANCYSTGDVSGDESVGGLAGNNYYGTITNCYSNGDVLASGADWQPGVGGGLVGENSWGGIISNCYASGSVSASGTEYRPGVGGGLVGENQGEVMASFWDTQTSGQVTSGGGMGKTTAEMQMESTFTDASWDFEGETVNGTEDIWRISEGVDYPRLTWELFLGAGPDDFVDVWLNDDPKTGGGGITRLVIGREISSRGSYMTIHGYGKSRPNDSDWGTIKVPYTGNPFVAVYDHGFKTNTLTIHLVTLDSLHVHSSVVFHDGTNRDYEADYYMHRAVGPEEIVINIDKDFEYIPQGWPLGLSVSQTSAVGLSARPYEALGKEPEYGSARSAQVLYGYIPLGNSNDSSISFAVDSSSINNWVLYIDTNNNEDLTDDGPPFRNEGTGKFAALISLHVEVISASGETIVRPYQLWFWLRESESPLFYTRCHYQSQISIGEEQYTAIAYEFNNHDALYQESGLWIDLNRDGKLDQSEENFEDGAIISIEGKEYVLRLNYP